MQRNVIETVMGGVVLIVAAMFVGIAFRSGTATTPAGYQVTAEFDDASGMGPGSEVRMSGVKIGTVAAQDLDPVTFLATITLIINDDIQLPVDSSAKILPDGLLGGNFLALEPGAEEEIIQSGGRIEFTQSAINVVELISRFVFNPKAGGQ